MLRPIALAAVLLGFPGIVSATPPVASYVFPAGGQRGATVPLRVGGLFLHDRSELAIEGPGVKAEPALRPTARIWFEGPLIPLPDSQQPEDYPVDRLGSATIDADALLGPRRLRLSASQGVATGPMFVVGDLPEIVEREIEGDPVPRSCTLPVTANGRIFPRGDIDLWSFALKRGETVTAAVAAARIHSPLVPRLEIVDAQGLALAEQGARPVPGSDASVRFTAPTAGTYFARVSDARGQGGPAFVYRLTLTTGLVIDSFFPLGGRRGEFVALKIAGQALPVLPVLLAIPPEAPDVWQTTISWGKATQTVKLDVGEIPEYDRFDATIIPPAMLNGLAEQANSPAWQLELKKGIRYEFDLRARRLGSPLCGVVTVKDAAGRQVLREMAADPGQDPSFPFQPEADGVFTVRVEERFRGRGGPESAYRLRVQEAGKPVPNFQLKATSDAVNVPRGGSAKLKVVVERIGGFKEPIELSVAGLPEGVHAGPATIAPGQATFDLNLTADAQAAVRTGSVAITGRTGNGVERALTASDATTLFVAVAVPTPFKFTGEYTMGSSPRGQPYVRRYKLERNGYAGPVAVSLADRQTRHLQGVTGATVVVPPEQSEFEYAVQLPPWIELGRTSRTVLMAVGEVADPDGAKHTVCFTSAEQNHQLIVVPEPGRLGIDLSRTTLEALPGRTVAVPFRIARAKGLNGEAVVEAEIPQHWKGVSAKPVRLDADRSEGRLELVIGEDATRYFNAPLTIRTRVGPAVAEAKLELFRR